MLQQKISFPNHILYLSLIIHVNNPQTTYSLHKSSYQHLPILGIIAKLKIPLLNGKVVCCLPWIIGIIIIINDNKERKK